jgi:hypothetical protein
VVLRDKTFRDEIWQDCEAGFGPSLHLMGTVEANGTFGQKDRDKAVEYFSRGGQAGHLMSEVFAWRLGKKNLEWIKTLPHAVYLSLKVIVIVFRSPDDMRVLT